MLIDFNATLKDLNDNPILEFVPERDASGKVVWEDEAKQLARGTQQPIVLKNLAAFVLHKTHENEVPSPTIAEQGERWALAQKVIKGGELDLNEKERDLVCQLVGYIKEWGTPISGQIYNILKK